MFLNCHGLFRYGQRPMLSKSLMLAYLSDVTSMLWPIDKDNQNSQWLLWSDTFRVWSRLSGGSLIVDTSQFYGSHWCDGCGLSRKLVIVTETCHENVSPGDYFGFTSPLLIHMARVYCVTGWWWCRFIILWSCHCSWRQCPRVDSCGM